MIAWLPVPAPRVPAEVRPAGAPTPATRSEEAGWATVALIVAAAAWLYSLVWPIRSGDMLGWLVPWYDHIVAHGQVGAFTAPFGNYTPPYLYLLSFITLFDGALPAVSLIKLLSVAGVGALAVAAYRLLRALGAPAAAHGSAWLLLLPSVIFNAAIMGQADMFWTAACVMAVAAAIGDRMRPMLVWCGVAVAFKAQAVFIAPFVVAVLLARRTPLPMWLIPAPVAVLAMMPAWLAGWPAADLATIYLRQAEWTPRFIGNAANPWSILEYLGLGPAAAEWKWVGLAAAVLATAAFLGHFGRRRLSSRQLLAAALLSSLMLPFLLPKMHERFFFLADILAFVFAWTVRRRSAVAVAALVQLSSVMTAAGLNAWEPGAALGCILASGALAILLPFALRGDADAIAPHARPVAPPTLTLWNPSHKRRSASPSGRQLTTRTRETGRPGHEDSQFIEVAQGSSPGLPGDPSSRPHLRHQQDQPPLQGAPGLIVRGALRGRVRQR